MLKILRSASVLALAVALAGCIQQRTVVVVNPDGSGNIVVSQMFSKEASQMMGGMVSGLQGAFGGDTNAPAQPAKDPLFDEDQFKSMAKHMGEGVEYVKAQKMEKDGARGAVIAYKFADVTKLSIDPGGAMKEAGITDGEAPEGKKADAPQLIRFGFEKGPTSKLSVMLPDDIKKAMEEKKAADGAAPEAKPEEKKETSPQDMMAQQMMTQMFKGMRMTVQVEVKGQVVKTTASHPDPEKPTRFTMMDINFDEILKTSAGLLAAGPGADTLKGLVKAGHVPGATIETNPDLTIEFK